MFGKLDTNQVEELLKQQFIGRIGCHADNITYVVPISYAYDGIYIYGHTFEGMKIDMMRKNSRVCFEIDDTKNLANWRSVVAWGEFEELKEGKERDEALQKLNARVLPVITSETMHISPQWPFPAEDTASIKGIAYRIRLTEKTGRFEKSPDQFFFAT
jgi:nitroimidazol reductase NimA-like FMN-containing flavoprotein (pyridoxamine 5'-phosphate oxidase superfamily)